jgi:putative copper export protein
MDWVVFAFQWSHILLAILWFGNSLSLAIVTIPALNRLPLPRQREIGAELGRQGVRVFDVVAPAVIVLGIVRGTLLGPIKGADALFGSAYGITWLVALVVAILTFLWGRFVIGPTVERMNAIPLAANGSAAPELEAAISRAKLVVILELVGFLTIFTCMILMRFGA